MSEDVIINKFPGERSYTAIVWLMLATGGTFAAASFSMAIGFWVLWLGAVGLLATYMAVDYRIEFGPTVVRERKELFGFLPISARVIAHRTDAEMLLLLTTSGSSRDDGTPWLNNHDLFLVLHNGVRIEIQKFDATTEEQPLEFMDECQRLAHRLSLPLAHESET